MSKKNKKNYSRISSTKKQDPPVRLNITFEEAMIKALNTRLLLKTSAKKDSDSSR
ncbi:MAG: hypothetical protein H7122_18350 [Chitinophagaceae bacterium]|nr:hypothetical protein [Chitinophagaceae bacterium]